MPAGTPERPSLAEHKREWEEIAEQDAPWAILSVPGAKYGAWDTDALFRTGEEEIAELERAWRPWAVPPARARAGLRLRHRPPHPGPGRPLPDARSGSTSPRRWSPGAGAQPRRPGRVLRAEREHRPAHVRRRRLRPGLQPGGAPAPARRRDGRRLPAGAPPGAASRRRAGLPAAELGPDARAPAAPAAALPAAAAPRGRSRAPVLEAGAAPHAHAGRLHHGGGAHGRRGRRPGPARRHRARPELRLRGQHLLRGTPPTPRL